jgi:hypothetical protein
MTSSKIARLERITSHLGKEIHIHNLKRSSFFEAIPMVGSNPLEEGEYTIQKALVVR